MYSLLEHLEGDAVPFSGRHVWRQCPAIRHWQCSPSQGLSNFSTVLLVFALPWLVSLQGDNLRSCKYSPHHQNFPSDLASIDNVSLLNHYHPGCQRMIFQR